MQMQSFAIMLNQCVSNNEPDVGFITGDIVTNWNDIAFQYNTFKNKDFADCRGSPDTPYV